MKRRRLDAGSAGAGACRRKDNRYRQARRLGHVAHGAAARAWAGIIDRPVRTTRTFAIARAVGIIGIGRLDIVAARRGSVLPQQFTALRALAMADIFIAKRPRITAVRTARNGADCQISVRIGKQIRCEANR